MIFGSLASLRFRLRAAVGLATILGTAVAQGALPDAAEAGDRRTVFDAIERGADVNERSADGTTALHWAAHLGDLAMIEELLDRGADVAVKNDYGVTPISAAAVAGDLQIIEALLDAGADVESPNAEGQTVLMAVARTGNTATAHLLIARGADVNAREQWGGQSALMWAAAQKQPDMVRVLVENGADVDARGKIHDWQRKVTAEPRIKVMNIGGFTPLLYAAREGCAACIEELLAGGADPDLSDPYGVTPLVMALLNIRFDAAAVLIEHGADVNQWDWWGRSPLYAAIDVNTLPAGGRADLAALDERTGLDIARMLLERGANPNMRLKKEPPMRHPTRDRGTIDRSSDGAILTTGATPLHRAAKSSDDAAIKLLLEYHADLSLPNTVMGITPFLTAAGRGHVFGGFTTATRGRFKTSQQAVETVRILLAAGANINDRDFAGNTAAHGAAEMGWSEVVQFLHGQGLDINAANDAGMTPRDVAIRRAHQETAALIEELTAAKTAIE